MSFKAPPFLQTPPGGEYRPMRVRITTSLVQNNYQGGDQSMVNVIADAILANHSAEISGWVNNLRQQNVIIHIEVVQRFLKFQDCFCIYSRNQKDETLDITLYPVLPQPTTSPVGSGGTFDVACPFQGYPVGSPYGASIYAWSAWNLYNGSTITNDDEQSTIVAPWAVAKVGRTGTCVQAISGQQYWECEVIGLPASTPPPLIVDFPTAIFDGTYVDCSIVDVTKKRMGYMFPTELDTWLTPAIGIIPKQLVPQGLIDNTVTDDMLVGLDTDDTFQVARTLYVLPTITEYIDVQTKNWQASQYWIDDATSGLVQGGLGWTVTETSTTGSNTEDFYLSVAGARLEKKFVLECQIMKSDWNPVYLDNVPTQPTISTDYPDLLGESTGPRGDTFTIGVDGKYLVTCVNQLTAMPIDAFTYDDITTALANQTAANNVAINTQIAAEAADVPPTTLVYSPQSAAADVRNQGCLIQIPGTTTYMTGPTLGISNDYSDTYTGGPFHWRLNSEMGRDDDYPIFVDDLLFIDDEFITVRQVAGSLGYTKGKFTDDDFSNSYLVGDYLNGPGANFPVNSGSLTLLRFDDDNLLSFLFEPNPDIQPPAGVNKIGSHVWAFKGRGDLLASTTSASDDGPLMPPIGGDGAMFNGVWSGVDLGTLDVDDVVMFAVDTGSRSMWFGKNGHWYDKNGQSQYAPGDPRLLVSLMLDGSGSGDDEQLYYPAATLRVGPSHVRFLFGEQTNYIAPGGFTYYGVSST